MLKSKYFCLSFFHPEFLISSTAKQCFQQQSLLTGLPRSVTGHGCLTQESAMQVEPGVWSRSFRRRKSFSVVSACGMWHFLQNQHSLLVCVHLHVGEVGVKRGGRWERDACYGEGLTQGTRTEEKSKPLPPLHSPARNWEDANSYFYLHLGELLRVLLHS